MNNVFETNTWPIAYQTQGVSGFKVTNTRGFNWITGTWDKGTQINATLVFGNPPQNDGDGPQGPIQTYTFYCGITTIYRIDESEGLSVSFDSGETWKNILNLSGDIGDGTTVIKGSDVEATSGYLKTQNGVLVQGQQVLFTQQPAIDDALDPNEMVDKFNTLLNALRTHGIIA